MSSDESGRKIVLVIDVEPDERTFAPSRGTSWSGFDETWAMVSRMREKLASGTSAARFGWYLRLDPQIEETWGSATWVVENHPDRFEAMEGAGDEIGVHPHPYRWDGSAGRWVSDYGETDWPITCLERSLDAYEEAFGHPCPSHRFGDRFLSDGLVRTLVRRGVGVDLTVEPGRPELPGLLARERSTGRIPDYRGVSTCPYRPSTSDFRRSTGGQPLPIWMLPLSMGRLPWPASSAARLLKRIHGSGREDPAVFTLSLGHFAWRFAWGLRQALEEHRRPVILVVRTGDLSDPEVGRRMHRNLARVVEIADRDELRFTTATDCLPPDDPDR